MLNSKWYTTPFAIFCFMVLALGSAVVTYVKAFLRVDEAFSKFVKQQDLDTFYQLNSTALATILTLSVLFALVAGGIVLVFIYYKKVVQLYYMQKNFINGFTHELKTPVTSLKLFLETLSAHELSREELLKCVDYMKKDTERLSENISQILDLGRIEDRKYPLDLSKIYLADFIRGILKKNAHIFKDVEVEVFLDESVVVSADHMLLETLIMNILSNAVVYNESLNPRIEIKTSDGQDEVEISFKDNGVGLKKTDKKRIFKKYYRVKKVVKGSGIGLYLAQHIAKLHKGSLEVDSPGEGRGSVFYIRLKKEVYAI